MRGLGGALSGGRGAWHDANPSLWNKAVSLSPFSVRTWALVAAGLLPLAAWAQGAASAPLAAASGPAVQVSTDPARAAAILKAAAELKKRPPPAAVGVVRAETAAGYRLMSGGVTAEDRALMQAERSGYSLWVSTVARPSGAYLADVELQVDSLAGPAGVHTRVLQRQLEGPWLLLALPAGSYEITGRYRDAADQPAQTLTQRVTIARQGQREAVLRFSSVADVDSEASAAAAASAAVRPPRRGLR